MTSDAARGYLLGELTEERSAALEQAVLVDRDVLELVEQVEHDLVVDYVDDRLSADDRARFERHYLASALHRNRVAVARALVSQARNTAPDLAIGIWSRYWGLAALALLAVAAALALTLWRGGTPEATNAPNVAQTPLPTPASPETPAPPSDRARPAEPVAEPIRVALLLPMVATRSRTATTPRVTLAPGTAFVDLLLEGPTPDLANAAAEVRSVDDRAVWTGRSAPPSTTPGAAPHAAMVSVPADRLPPDDYILTLTDRSGQILGRYFFRVSAGG